MKIPFTGVFQHPRRAHLREAAMWIAKLRSPSRSRQTELDCLAWQEKSSAHRHAFLACSDAMDEIPREALRNVHESAKAEWNARQVRLSVWRSAPVRFAVAVAMAVLAFCLPALMEFRAAGHVFSTGLGEQRQELLADGSRLSLNTATRVRAEFGRTVRQVTLEEGEAMFEVAHDPERRFVVKVADSEIVAKGTRFAVRFTPGAHAPGVEPSVTLIDGQVSVSSPASLLHPIVLRPGQRLRLVRSPSGRTGAPQVDEPLLESVTAWTRRQAIFERATLAEAVAEMNRYSRTLIVLVGDNELMTRGVSGRYPTGDNHGFATAMAALHRLRIVESKERIELSVPP